MTKGKRVREALHQSNIAVVNNQVLAVASLPSATAMVAIRHVVRRLKSYLLPESTASSPDSKSVAGSPAASAPIDKQPHVAMITP